LIELIVIVGVVAVLGVIALAALTQATRLQRIQQTATILTDVRLALYNTGAGPPAFQQTVGDNAGRLSHLVFPIVNGDQNSCGANYKVQQRNNWPDGAPYSRYAIDSVVGLPTPIGIGDNVLVRNPPGGGAGSTLAIVMPSVDSMDVALLDNYMDSGDGAAGGFVRWSPVAGSTMTMSYTFTIDNGC
jgi:hypothetical protein